ncbi:MAG: 3-deoxy-D-manno-octulosonic acid transferase [Sedimentisphaerales bacterium]|nr:3-deoxy-D-manno-octulosonic acid transferase [Sedimentisphaerales bacterium]
MRFVLDVFYVLAAVAISPMVVYRIVRYRRYRAGWAQRFGKIARKNPHKKCIWLHAVSVGELNAAKTIIEALQNKFADFEIVISTTTDTGFSRARALFGKHQQVFYFPLDFSWIMRRAFRRIAPAMCLLMELEVWPNFVEIAHRLNVPVIVVNGRISDKSLSRYKKVKPFVKKIFRKVTLVLAQTQEYAERFRELGCPDERVIVTGSLKYDTAEITDKVEGADTLATQLFGTITNHKSKIANRLWVAGATGPGEEEIILEVYKDLARQGQFGDLRLVIVPRKPERFDEVAELIKQKGFDLIRYSQVKRLAAEDTESTEKSIINNQLSIILGDTMGDLRKFYCLATIIFVGRSLVPMGGSDMMEAAALGKCTIFGPYAFNFKQAVDALLAGSGAIMVKDKEELLRTIRKCLSDPAFAEEIGRNGREVIRKNQGATAGTIQQIAGFLKATDLS